MAYFVKNFLKNILFKIISKILFCEVLLTNNINQTSLRGKLKSLRLKRHHIKFPKIP